MGKKLLVNDQLEAAAKFIQTFNEYTPVATALWINPAESDKWHLYIASDRFDDGKVGDGYAEVLRILPVENREDLDPLRITLIGASDPIARRVIQKTDLYKVRKVRHFNDLYLGGIVADEAYIYPPLTPATATP